MTDFADRAREIVLWTRQDRFRSAVDLQAEIEKALAEVEREAMERACRAVCDDCATDSPHTRVEECWPIRDAFAPDEREP